jgi:hypothetical protein
VAGVQVEAALMGAEARARAVEGTAGALVLRRIRKKTKKRSKTARNVRKPKRI